MFFFGKLLNFCRKFGLQNVDWTRKVAMEKDINKDQKALDNYLMTFDDTGNFLIYPSPIGLRVYNIVTEKVVRNLGKMESSRFIGVAICRAMPSASERLKGAALTAQVEASDNPALRKSDPDPMIVSFLYFWIFKFKFSDCDSLQKE